MKSFKPISRIQVPLSCNKRMKNHEGIIRMFVIRALIILFFVFPAAHSMLGILRKRELIPNTAPIHPNSVEVCMKLNQGPII